MDNSYLKTNVLPALTEALTAMAVQAPEDRVEFVGKYLIAYVERQKTLKKKNGDIDVMEKQLSEFLVSEQIKQDEKELAEAPAKQKAARYLSFLGSIQGYSSKQDAFDAVTKFLETQLEIPAAYVAVRQVVGESVDVLKYIAKGDNDPLILGKKLNKPAADDSEEAPERQGVSFEAFKVPEIPESDEPPAEDGQEVTPKGPPPLLPFSVINVMRDKRVKFFGIPKLGAYVAVPFTYSSVDHDSAITFTPAEGETPASFAIARKDAQFMIACDTIGCYRLFKQEEVDRMSSIGNELLTLFARLEDNSEVRLKEFLNSEALSQLNTAAAEFAAKIGELEAAAVAASAPTPIVATAPAEGDDPEAAAAAAAAPVEEAPETKAARETAAAIDCWSKTANSSDIRNALISFAQWETGVPSSVVKLFTTLAFLSAAIPADYSDRCGDASWAVMYSSGFLSRVADVVTNFDPTASIVLMSKDQKFANIKAFVEANGVLDAGAYPNFLPVCGSFLVPWVTKAIAAREAQLVLQGEGLEVASW
jgi:hypothetical protein